MARAKRDRPANKALAADGLTEYFAGDGALARRLEGYIPRASQLAMAQTIERALRQRGVAIMESGTGTGKTLAYLAPALRSGLRVIVSTGTRNLQDQLFARDLPLVRETLGVPVRAALLKGRANYLCRYRLARTELEGQFRTRAEAAQVARVRQWAARTRSGDIAELTEVSEAAEIWPRLTSTADNCLGGRCPDYDRCFVGRARREAAEAEVVIVNHHLFFADLVLKQEGFAELLPGAEAVIFDEAHQLPEIASIFFGQALSSAQVFGLCRDTLAEEQKERSGVAGLAERAAAVEKAVAELRLALGRDARRDLFAAVGGEQALATAMAALQERLQRLAEGLSMAAGKGEGLASCHRRSQELLERLQLMAKGASDEYVGWWETSERGFVMRLTPLELAPLFQRRLEEESRAWIFTSATLAVGEDFSHFQRLLGLEAASCHRWESPFDYQDQALLYLPAGLPDPSAPNYTDAVIDAALPVLAASRGRAFLLFTSHRALARGRERLEGRLPYPLLVQGSQPRHALIERFRAEGDAVLLGTSSFWEGVDVRGDALSCVIIDKLPFAAPDDPILRARADALARAGGNPFLELQLPAAVIALKQGAGRLIRDVADRGLLMICDPRLRTRGYGRVFLDSLPPMPRTERFSDVEKFFSPGPVSRPAAEFAE